ncbi:acyl-CoA thioesterase II [Vibrio sp. 10N.286.49.C2]|uniref:acyl-CoA thioesterase n=1 Tax=unclassified Vibrio TaxID=2614977 RepID=UPI000C82E957|nr:MULTISPECIES: thioesterase family protein [unclassified Vibrio]PMH36698.1 acyl-CoA thioesterase II [Vibrio sp. 10N.286.49.C2]PMH54686.1 acyl-CoA thioesterase II [Vibrio sp. 10N.286.49.B1]PMH78318.1 acyl-CoA thioesterase II [Vibrio sp. 10N.286.48.B7]
MHFDELLKIARQRFQEEGEMSIPSSWGQGRTVFGGVSAALLYTAMQSKLNTERELRTLNTNFVGPLLVDVPFHFQVEVLREGKSVSQLSARLIQNDQVVVFQQACFGFERDSKIRVENSNNHIMPSPDELPRFPDVAKGAPNYTAHIDLALARGHLPFTASKDSHSYGWMRFKQAPSVITDAHLICLVDAWPPGVLQMMSQPAPASTMMWNLEFIHPHEPVGVEDWFAYQSHTRQAAQGYAHAEANVWNNVGQLVAISRQSIAIFD